MESAAQQAKEKSETKADSLAEWQSMLEDVLYPLMNLADNDLKDASRRISSVKGKERKKKEPKKNQAAAREGSDHDDGSDNADAED